MTVTSPIVNPYAKARPKGGGSSHNGEIMGRQSQQRISNTKRAYSLAGTNSFKKKRKGQLTLVGEVAFDPLVDCKICVAHAIKRVRPETTIPKRAHHPNCPKNTKTKGKGALSSLQIATEAEEKRLQTLYTMPLSTSEKASGRYLTEAAGKAFFLGQTKKKHVAPKMTSSSTGSISTVESSSQYYCKAVTTMTADSSFQQKHAKKGAPLAMIAFAMAVMAESNNKREDFESNFNGLTMEVPPCKDNHNPHYHSIVGQHLLLVDWKRMFGISVKCADRRCAGVLQNDRTSFSKNKTLFPIFSLHGAPSWCIVQSMICPICSRRFDANDGELLVSLPSYAAEAYPVDTKYAISNKHSHIHRKATDVFDSIMLTYGNGEMCSRLLYNAINRDYISRLKGYYSFVADCCSNHEGTVTPTLEDYIELHGGFIRQYPPLGDNIRDVFDEAASSSNNHWGISDHDRHTREIQGVGCTGIFAQDHTFEICKNYQRKVNAKALWDVATSTGEIASAVLVPSTMSKHFSHAARAVLRRSNFNATVMYSDTWPHGDRFWKELTHSPLQGRLGLFHFEKRILSTLKKKHVDFNAAVTDLLAALYQYYPPDYDRLLSALMDGSLSSTGKSYSAREISEMKQTKQFRERYNQFLRKQMHPTSTMLLNLDDWFAKYKVVATEGSRPAGGRLDPVHLCPLFTPETKEAVGNCKEKAQFLSDPLPIGEMYDCIQPNPNSRHSLVEFLSKRGESKLESFHDRASHFANSGMRQTLADNLNLMGTARHNLQIRHKRAIINKETHERSVIPGAWEKVVSFFNHSELWYVNRLARQASLKLPFPDAEKLQADNGERFFSEYMNVLANNTAGFDSELGICLCAACRNHHCGDPPAKSIPEMVVQSVGETVPAAPAIISAEPVKKVSRQQAGQDNAIAVVGAVVPSVGEPAIVSMVPMMQPFFYPAAAHYYYVAPTPTTHYYCCEAYRQWRCCAKVGRPPHERHCPLRQKERKKKTEGALF